MTKKKSRVHKQTKRAGMHLRPKDEMWLPTGKHLLLPRLSTSRRLHSSKQANIEILLFFKEKQNLKVNFLFLYSVISV